MHCGNAYNSRINPVLIGNVFSICPCPDLTIYNPATYEIKLHQSLGSEAKRLTRDVGSGREGQIKKGAHGHAYKRSKLYKV